MNRLDALGDDALDIGGAGGSTLQRRLDRARAALAASVTLDAPSPTLGSILLRADQIEAVRRVLRHLRRDGGCLLADDVGTGKTFVALAAARVWTHPLIIVPASLRTTWSDAARRADVRCSFATHEALSRGRVPAEQFDGVVVDESHRFRATSRRHAVLADVAARAPVLLLSATPMQNRARELAAQVALFLGEAAYHMDPAQLAGWVVRSVTDTPLPLPRVRPPRWIPVEADDAEVLREILALPPPPRAADAGDGGVLLQLSLVRAWASSRAALVATVQRRRRTLAAIEQCHQEGRLPTRRELRSWTGSSEVQLGFPTLLASSLVDEGRLAVLARAIEREAEALTALLHTIDRGSDPDEMRSAALRDVRRAHSGESILAFSEWRSTVHAYWRLLRDQRGLGVLSASEARIVSGRVTRDELLARFAPRAQRARVPAEHERVTLLLTTDILSEGVNLQDASVVVHLDLPWNPARLAQRLGRLRRPGGASEVASYLMAPPARAAVLLEAESRLRAKLAHAERTIGRGVTVLPALGAPNVAAALDPHGGSGYAHRPSRSTAELHGEIALRLARWRLPTEIGVAAGDIPLTTAAVRASTRGWIALLDDGRLVATVEEAEQRIGATDSPETILRALELASGAARSASDAEWHHADRELQSWIARDWVQQSAGVDMTDTPLRRRIRRAIDDALRTAPRHRRAEILRGAAIVRRALTGPLPLGVERALSALADEGARRFEWVEDSASVVARAPVSRHDSAERVRPTPRVWILFGAVEDV